MTCDLPTILRQACENDFDKAAEDAVMARAILLQLLCNFTGGATQQCFASDGPPTTQIPAFGAGTCWDYTNKVLYSWNPISLNWE